MACGALCVAFGSACEVAFEVAFGAACEVAFEVLCGASAVLCVACGVFCVAFDVLCGDSVAVKAAGCGSGRMPSRARFASSRSRSLMETTPSCEG